MFFSRFFLCPKKTPKPAKREKAAKMKPRT
jgi:hypothetical protein